jgi:hypothetical protein
MVARVAVKKESRTQPAIESIHGRAKVSFGQCLLSLV